MFGFGSDNSFEIDGVEFTVDGAWSSAADGFRQIYKEGTPVAEIDGLASVVPVDLEARGEEYSVFLIFDSGGNLESAITQDDDGALRDGT
jgi:hypothetical protein